MVLSQRDSWMRVCYHRAMGRIPVMGILVLLVAVKAGAADAPDALSQARQAYNDGRFEAAVQAADRARQSPALASSADLIAARAYLERFRESSAVDDLANARDRLRRLDPKAFGARERAEY